MHTRGKVSAYKATPNREGPLLHLAYWQQAASKECDRREDWGKLRNEPDACIGSKVTCNMLHETHHQPVEFKSRPLSSPNTQHPILMRPLVLGITLIRLPMDPFHGIPFDTLEHGAAGVFGTQVLCMHVSRV